MIVKSQRLTAYRQNLHKNRVLDIVFNELAFIRDKINEYIYDHLICVHTNLKSLIQDYAYFTSDIIPAWCIQKEFHFQVKLYQNKIKVQFKHFKPKIQTGFKVSYYKKTTKSHKRGDVKEFKLVKKSTNLCRFIKYLVYFNLDNNLDEYIASIKNDWIQEAYTFYKNKPYFDRILKLCKDIQYNRLTKIKPLVFKNQESVLRLHKHYANIIHDRTNTLYKWWFYIRLKGGLKLYLPLQFNAKYHTPDKWIAKEFLLFRGTNKKKVHVVTTSTTEPPKFINGNYNVEGLDVNLKHNFAICSNGLEFDFDREFLLNQIKLLRKLDNIGYQNLTTQQSKRLYKICRRLKGYFDFLCSNILRTLKDKGVTDLVVEDLLLKDKFGFNEEFKIKWNRLSKMLHLSDVKNALIRIGEKLGIRVHVTQAAYSSQQCPECGAIDKRNRSTQETFKCIKCGHSLNADLNASLNLKMRFLSDVLREKLHTKDNFGRLRPRKFSRSKLKSILQEEFVSSRSLPNMDRLQRRYVFKYF